MKNPKTEVGDVVLLQSPLYKARNCKAVVYSSSVFGRTEFKILDNTTFNHSHFRTCGRHHQEDNDTWVIVKPEFFAEDLFKI